MEDRLPNLTEEEIQLLGREKGDLKEFLYRVLTKRYSQDEIDVQLEELEKKRKELLEMKKKELRKVKGEVND